MKVFLTSNLPAEVLDVRVHFVFDSEVPARFGDFDGLSDEARNLAKQEGFKGKLEQHFLIQTHGKGKATRVLFFGLGSQKQFTPEVLRLAVGRATKSAIRFKAKRIALTLPASHDDEAVVKAAAEGLELGAYRYTKWKTKNEDDAPHTVETVTLVLPKGERPSAALNAALVLGRRVGEATNWARDLVNEPPDTMTPTILAERAQRMAKEAKLKIEVMGKKDIEKLKMGMFLAVAKGSIEEPRLVRIKYIPTSAAARKERPICLVGKAVTFDSGGLSIKPSDSMIDMKSDMAGSAAVLGAMKVVAAIAPPFPVYAYFGACENMLSGTSYRIGDVLVSRLGKTVEVRNTDAEGRLVLGDVLAFANEEKPRALIDLATLTGACIVALGMNIAGAFGDDDTLMHSVLEAARSAGEDLWRLPLTPYLKDSLKSDVADLKNLGDRWGGAISAALFLKEFVGNTPWVHLDIAGPAMAAKERGYYAKGATGVGVRTLVEFIRRGGALA